MKKIIIPIIFLIILCFSATANTEYTEIGSNDSYFQGGIGFFNSELSDVCGVGNLSCTTRNLNSPSFIPLVADLDGDAVNEIIAFDGINIRLYQTSSLTIIDAFASATTIKTAKIFDIDGDSLPEIIIAGGTSLEIIKYNGTDIFNESSFTVTGVVAASEYALNCNTANSCLAIHEEDVTGTAAIKYASFNSTQIIVEGQIEAGAASIPVCLSEIPFMPVADYDNDGDDEFIVSMGDPEAFDDILIKYLFLNSSMHVVIEQTATENLITLPTGGCSDKRHLFTSPLVFDIDGSSSNGLETVIGIMIDADEFNMHSYSNDGSFLDDYPEVFDADGILLSNPFRANIFSDTGTEDFCVMGYDQTDGFVDLLCASEQTGNIPETEEFRSNVAPAEILTFNVSSGINAISHSVQMSTVIQDGTNMHEIVNSYGIWEVEWAGFFATANRLDLIWENEKGDSAVVPVDVEQVGREDLLVLTSTNIWYFDDGFSNSPGQINEYTVNPCIDQTWKQNTTVEVTITPFDIDSDDISARAILYQGQAFEQDSGWSVNASTGTTFAFSFAANETIGNSVLRLMARDTENPLLNDTIDLTISVATNGVEFGECITSVDELAEEEEEAVDEEDDEIVGNTLREVFSAGGAIPEPFYPLVGFAFVAMAWAATFVGIAQFAQQVPQLGSNELVMFFVPVLAAMVAWILAIIAEMIPGWTIFAGIIIAAALIGFRFYKTSSQPGQPF